MRLLVRTQAAERYDHCVHGVTPRPTRDPDQADAMGLTLEHWFDAPQPDDKHEYWLHVCNVANPTLARELFRRSVSRLLPHVSNHGNKGTQLLSFMHAYAGDEGTSLGLDEYQEMEGSTRPTTARLKRHRKLVNLTCRWELDLDESVSPALCVPALCEVAALEGQVGYREGLHELWTWWKTMTTLEEWAGGHF